MANDMKTTLVWLLLLAGCGGMGTPPNTLVLGPDGNYWITDFKAGSIARMRPNGVISTFALPAESNPNSIAVGPDGNLWFTERGTNRIGRITIAGRVVEFGVPTPNAGVTGIVPGRHRDLWFIESDVNKIGLVTTSGAMKEFPVPAPPDGLVVGSTGSAWLKYRSSDTVRAISESGSVMVFPIK